MRQPAAPRAVLPFILITWLLTCVRRPRSMACSETPEESTEPTHTTREGGSSCTCAWGTQGAVDRSSWNMNRPCRPCIISISVRSPLDGKESCCYEIKVPPTHLLLTFSIPRGMLGILQRHKTNPDITKGFIQCPAAYKTPSDFFWPFHKIDILLG